jgi:hypothetical protein
LACQYSSHESSSSSPSSSSSLSTLSSASSSPRHAASLVNPASHSPALLELVEIKMNPAVIDYVVDCVIDTVDYAMGRPSTIASGHSALRRPSHTSFHTFATNVITRAEVSTPTVLVALSYMDRAKPHLHIALEEWALERVFLGALIVASKYLNDSTLKNVHWALCTGVFGKRDVGRIEREFLDVLDFELSITEDALLSHHDGLTAFALPHHSHRINAVVSSKPQTLQQPPAHPLHHRTRSSHSVPELSPCSPESSSGSSSPQTPESASIEEQHVPVKQHHHSFASRTLEILREFPSLPHSSTKSSSSRNHHRSHHQQRFPIRLGA